MTETSTRTETLTGTETLRKTLTLEQRLESWLARAAGQEFSARDAQRGCTGHKKHEVLYALGSLYERGLITVVQSAGASGSLRYKNKCYRPAPTFQQKAAPYFKEPFSVPDKFLCYTGPDLSALIPDSTEPDISRQVPVLHGDRACISDTHFPYHSGSLLRQFCLDAYNRGVKRFVLIGDMMDGNQFHPKRGGCQQHSRRWQDDAELAKTVLRGLLQVFDGGEVLTGNHDAWFQAHFRGQVDPEWIMENIFHEFADKLTFTRFEQAKLFSGGKEFRLLHGANYSGPNPIGVAKRLSAKFEAGIVMGHQHHQEAGWSVSGKHRVVCMGGAHDPALFGYTQISPRTNPCQTQGYAIIRNGEVEVFDKQFSALA